MVCEAGEASSDDGSDVQRSHLIRVLGDQVAQLMPQLSKKKTETRFFNFPGQLKKNTGTLRGAWDKNKILLDS